jgi:sugar phosphate isomerase/epimerase
MKLAFSTLGCPGWGLDRVIDWSAAHGYDGVELRLVGDHIDLMQVPDLQPGRRAGARRRFEDAGTEICCVDSSVNFAARDPSERERQLEACQAHVELAADLGAPMVRVFGGNVPEGVSIEEATAWIGDALAAAGEAATGSGVAVAVETHDDFRTGEACAAVLARADHANVGCVWDVHHPFRAGETVEETLRHLGDRIIHVHLKDGTVDADGVQTLTRLGDGTLPLGDMLRGLAGAGYDDYLSFEWEKRWHPELAAPEVAFPHYVKAVRTLLNELG